MTKLPPEVLARIDRNAEEKYSSYGDAEPNINCYKAGAIAEAEKAVDLVSALELAEKAIEALTLSQKEVGMGLLGTYIVIPETLQRIREALRRYRGETS